MTATLKPSHLATLSAAALALALTGGSALAQKKYDTGATDTEIKIGHTIAYSGPASGYGPIGKAITYALNQWEALLRYTDDPTLDIDNNISERTLRMVVIGRRNYLFAGSEAGAKRAAIIYSLVASCKLHQIDPFAYFADVLKRVSTHPAEKIDDLLPGEWKKSHPRPAADQPVIPEVA